MQSSSARRRAPFIPWLSVLIIGASAHAAWLIHELREPASPCARAQVEIHVEIQPRVVESRARKSWHTPPPARARSLGASCRRAGLDLRPRPEDLDHDLDLWIRQVDRYRYTIDRRALERVALANYAVGEREGLGVVAQAWGLADSIELRNIAAGTPLFVLGLRSGDRLRAIATRRGAVLEEVELALERRGRPIALVYELI
jgi:hypothetical protein